MAWHELQPIEALRRVRSGVPAVDVRSEGEFATGYIPGYQNIPILNDNHRHIVGLTYKTEGSAQAVAVGHRLVDPLRHELVARWTKALGSQGLVACWRGGLRSEITSVWLEEAGVNGERVAGGYKAQRKILLETIDQLRPWIVLDGFTGSGKTKLIGELPQDWTLNLEGLAGHRGSAFGGFPCTPQPSQQTFENGVGLHLLDREGPILVENESGMIGSCSLPVALRQAIETAPRVRILASLEDRVARIFQEYVADSPLTPQALMQLHLGSLQRISKALGGVRTVEIAEKIRLSFAHAEQTVESHRPWIESLLREYYDPRYEHGLKAHGRPLQFEGHYDDVRNYLTHSLDRRRT